jgi:bifunctional UDP-N-acetylglucosamine pyrophosphorylase/glucosamine-1-phosphate N-acetyltransferase
MPDDMRAPTRVLVIPAAGLGSRLQSALPKALTPVLGRPMLDHVIDRHASYCQNIVVVAHPAFAAALRAHLAGATRPAEVVVQMQPSGMLDALLVARDAVRMAGADRVWVTWCDQVAVSGATVAALDDHDRQSPPPPLVLPTVRQSPPYIHFDRDADARIVGVRQRREGDEMPAAGESDMGLFSLGADVFLEALPAFAAGTVPGQRTGERNFLPFVPWLAARGPVVTFPVADSVEAQGINTPDDLVAIERHLKARHA